MGLGIEKEQFCKILNRVKRLNDVYQEINNILTINQLEGMIETNLQDEVLDLLSLLTYDKEDQYGTLISWWVYDTDFGRDEDMAAITIEDKITIIKTPEELYDFLEDQYEGEN